MDELIKEMNALNVEESPEDVKIAKIALKILKKTTEMIEKNYTNPKELFNDLFEDDLRYFLTPEEKLIEINRTDVKDVLKKNDLFSIVTKCVSNLFEHIKIEMGKKNFDENEVFEIIKTISNLTLIMEIAKFNVDSIQIEINKFIIFLFRFFFDFNEINTSFNLLMLCDELILEFSNRHDSRLFITNEIKNRFETIKNTQILLRNINVVLKGIEIECFMHYAIVLREVLHKNWFNPNGNDKKISKEILNDLNQILIDLKPYLTRSLKFVFDHCLTYLI